MKANKNNNNNKETFLNAIALVCDTMRSTQNHKPLNVTRQSLRRSVS